MKTYVDDDGRRRCQECDGYVAARARKCRRCANRAQAAADAEAAELKRKAEAKRKAEESAAASAWRYARLRRYVAAVLAVTGKERLDFFERNPIDQINR